MFFYLLQKHRALNSASMLQRDVTAGCKCIPAALSYDSMICIIVTIVAFSTEIFSVLFDSESGAGVVISSGTFISCTP